MLTTISNSGLVEYVCRQLNFLFPDGDPITPAQIAKGVAGALERIEYCFRRSASPRYCDATQPRFDHLYSDQYLMFLWYLSSVLWEQLGDCACVNKIYLLNKCLHGFDCSYSTKLPAIFMVVHGNGTVLGKAAYADFFVTYHGCTVGQAHGVYPTFGTGVGLGTGAVVLGNTVLGSHSSVGAGCTLVNKSVPAHSSVYRTEGGQTHTRPTAAQSIASEYFLPEFLNAAS